MNQIHSLARENCQNIKCQIFGELNQKAIILPVYLSTKANINSNSVRTFLKCKHGVVFKIAYSSMILIVCEYEHNITVKLIVFIIGCSCLIHQLMVLLKCFLFVGNCNLSADLVVLQDGCLCLYWALFHAM